MDKPQYALAKPGKPNDMGPWSPTEGMESTFITEGAIRISRPPNKLVIIKRSTNLSCEVNSLLGAPNMEMEDCLSIALVDDHELFRQGLRSLIANEPDFTIVGEAGDAPSAYDVVASKHPQVVVMDLTLPGVDGITATRELMRRSDVRVLILTSHLVEKYALEALAAGASGYALKTDPFHTLAEAIRTVAADRTYLSPHLPKSILNRCATPAKEAPTDHDPIAILSDREAEVFQLVTQGFNNQRMAKQLEISVKTVETHRSRVHRKLGIHTVAELMIFASRNGLLKH